jgi:site-specific recombinase XerD
VPHESELGNPIVSGIPPDELEKNTLKNYEFIFTRFQEALGDRQIDSITSDDVLSFLTGLSTSSKPTTKRHRYSSLKAFFNFLKNSVDPGIQNPYDTAMLRKMFRERPPQQWKIVEKDLVDEIIFRTVKPRNRIMLELMARGGMRVGEVLKIRPMDIHHLGRPQERQRVRGCVHSAEGR